MAGAPQTYSDLQTSVQRWMNDSVTYASVIGEIIALTEKRLSRELNTPDMEASTTLPLVNGVSTLPDGFMEMRSAWVVTPDNRRLPLQPLTEQDFTQGFGQTAYSGSIPCRFTISGSNFMVRPIADAYQVMITYKQAIPALSDTNTTNWLLLKWPDLYISACIVTAALFGFEDSRISLLASNADALVDEINTAGRKARYGVGPLVARAPVGDYGGSSVGYTRGGYTSGGALVDDDGFELTDG